MRLDPHAASRHFDRLLVVARALTRNHHAAEDLVQDTYAAVLARPRHVTRGDELGYLLTALRNRFRDDLRAAARRPVAAAEIEAAAFADTTFSTRPDMAAEHREVLAAVESLPSPYRETIVAVDVLGLSYEEAARALGVPAGTIMSRLYRGRDKVAGALRTPVPA